MDSLLLCVSVLRACAPGGALHDLPLERCVLVCALAPVLVEAAGAAGVAPEVLVAVGYEETRWSTSVGTRNGCGVMQVVPRYVRPTVTCTELLNPEVGVRLGAQQLGAWARASKGDTRRALARYHVGWVGMKERRGRHYAARVLARASALPLWGAINVVNGGCACE